MCSRYGRRNAEKQTIAEHYRIREWEHHGLPLTADYNITPGTFQPVVKLNHDTGERELTQMEWGLVPH
jgi:putative SOS response-associated peptidase YedK